MAYAAIADRDHTHPLHEPQSFLTKYIWSQDHKVIAIQYTITAIAIGLVALALSVMMRLQLGFPLLPRGHPQGLEAAVAVDQIALDELPLVLRDLVFRRGEVAEDADVRTKLEQCRLDIGKRPFGFWLVGLGRIDGCGDGWEVVGDKHPRLPLAGQLNRETMRWRHVALFVS